MELFCCDQCGHVDIVDLAYPRGIPQTSHTPRLVCTLCQTGQWHGHFPLQKYDPNKDNVINRPKGTGLGEVV